MENGENNRYAFEWFMESEDLRYWGQTKSLIDSKCKRITALAATSAVIGALGVLLAIFSLAR